MRNAQLEGVASRVEVKYGNACSIPHGDATFDAVVSCLVLHRIKSEYNIYIYLYRIILFICTSFSVFLQCIYPIYLSIYLHLSIFLNLSMHLINLSFYYKSKRRSKQSNHRDLSSTETGRQSGKWELLLLHSIWKQWSINLSIDLLSFLVVFIFAKRGLSICFGYQGGKFIRNRRVLYMYKQSSLLQHFIFIYLSTYLLYIIIPL